MTAVEPPQATQATLSPQPAPLRVAAYVRYSSLAQREGYSIEAQRAAIEQEAVAWQARTGQAWRITWYEEPAKSARAAKLAQRVVFARLMRDAAASGYDLVVVHKLDRFARSLAHQLQFINDLARSGVGFYSVVEKPDFTSPQGRLMAHLFGALAQFYSDNLGQEVKKGLYERAKAGLAWGAPPYGYRYPTPAETGQARGARLPFQPDDEPGGTWQGYQRVKALLLDGYSDVEVARRMTAEAVEAVEATGEAGEARWRLAGLNAHSVNRRALVVKSVRDMRINPFYCPFAPGDDRGTVVVRGQRFRGAHVPACTWDEWRAMQSSAAQRRPRGGRPRGQGADASRTPSGRGAVSEFSGIAVCATCGTRLYARRETTVRGVARDAERTVRYYDHLYCPAARTYTPCADAGNAARAHDLTAAWRMWLAANLSMPDGWRDLISRTVRLRAHGARWRDLDGTSGGGADRPDAAERASLSVSLSASHLDAEQVEHELVGARARRRAAIEARLEGWIEAAEARARVADADREIARLRALSETLASGEAVYARRIRDAAGVVTALAETWGDMTAEERARAAALLIEPNGLRVKLLSRAARQSGKRGLAPDARYAPIVSVRLRPPFAELADLLAIPQKEA